MRIPSRESRLAEISILVYPFFALNLWCNKNILSDVSFLMRNGEFMYLIGKTGSGKSSLLKILYGEIKIKDG